MARKNFYCTTIALHYICAYCQQVQSPGPLRCAYINIQIHNIFWSYIKLSHSFICFFICLSMGDIAPYSLVNVTVLFLVQLLLVLFEFCCQVHYVFVFVVNIPLCLLFYFCLPALMCFTCVDYLTCVSLHPLYIVTAFLPGLCQIICCCSLLLFLFFLSLGYLPGLFIQF